jgi:hypothetical protein
MRPALTAAGHQICLESNSVILDPQDYFAAGASHVDGHVVGTGVFSYVGQGFTGDAEDLGLRRCRQRR